MHNRVASSSSQASVWAPSWWRADARWLALLAPALAFAGHLASGVMLPKPALTLEIAAGLLLASALAAPAVRRDLTRMTGVGAPALAFGLCLLAIFWSLTPYVPGGPHPVWAYVGLPPGAATIDKSQTLIEIIKLIGLGAFFALGACLGGSDGRARAALNVIVALGGAFALFEIIGYAGAGLGTRLGGTFGNPNGAATLFAMLLMIAIAGAVATARGRERGGWVAAAPHIGAALILAAGLLATASRGGMVAAALGLLTFVVLQVFSGRAKWTRATLGLAGALLVAAVILALAGDVLVNRLTQSGFDDSGRHLLFAVHWAAFKQAPWFGYGLGNFDALNKVLLDAANLRELWSIRAAHNVYLSWLELGGIAGAAPMFVCIALVVGKTVRRTLERTRLTTWLFGLLATDVVVLVHGASDFALEIYSMAAFWTLLLGLQFAASQGSSRR